MSEHTSIPPTPEMPPEGTSPGGTKDDEAFGPEGGAVAGREGGAVAGPERGAEAGPEAGAAPEGGAFVPESGGAVAGRGDGVVIDTEAAMKGPATPPARPAPAAAAPPAKASPEPVPGQRWREIQAAFVDDPRGAVNSAAGAVDAAVEEFVAVIRSRQAALASSWQDGGADTEALRIALLDYRAFWDELGPVVASVRPPR